LPIRVFATDPFRDHGRRIDRPAAAGYPTDASATAPNDNTLASGIVRALNYWLQRVSPSWFLCSGAAVTQPVSCPDPSDLKQLAHGNLSDSKAEALRNHVLGCSGCAQFLQSFHSGGSLLTVQQTVLDSGNNQAPAARPTLHSVAQDKPQAVPHSVDEDARKRFEAAWIACRPEPIAKFLPPPNTPQYLATLVELIHIELEFAWKRWKSSEKGASPDCQPLLVEAYLERFPDLESPTILRDLVEVEWLLRQQHGDRPSSAEYQARFPNLVDGEDLERLRRRDGLASGTPEVPGFEILGELGRGGMGVVYKARQAALKRIVAVKMILAGAHTTGADLARFRSEAEAVARLRHPNIVQVYEIGELNGLPFFSLEYVDGGTLAGKVNGAPLPERQAAQMVETLARAMHEAHQSGIVHRDLKPANVLLTAAGAVKIADFGLAKKLDETGQTAAGAIMGTPSYMAPEQARGDLREIGPATDVYALGGILYELLTGRPPFRGATKLDTLWQVLNQNAIPPSRLQPRVPRDLETVCLKCLEKEPGRRYRSAEALAEDLRRFQAGEPTRARPLGRMERGWKWVRRRPVAAGLLTVSTLLLLALVGLTVGWFFHGQVLAALDVAETARKDADTQRTAAQVAQGKAEANERAADREKQRAEMLSYLLGVQAAHHAWQSNDVPAALVYLDQWRAWERRGWEFDYVRGLCSGGSRLTLKGHTGPVKTLAMSADGKRIVSGGSWDQTVKVWNADSGQEILSFRPHAANIFGVAISGDGKRIVTSGNDMTVNVWDAATAQKVRSIDGRTHQFTCLGLSADGKRIVTGSCVFTPQGFSLPGEMTVCDVDAGRDIFLLKGHSSGIFSVAFSADGKRIVSGSQDGTVKIWDAEKGKEMLTLKGHSGAVTSAAVTNDGKRIVSCSADGTVKVWDARTGQQALTLTGHTGVVQSVAVSSDGQRIYSGGSDQTVKVWDGTSGEQLLTFKGHTDAVLSLAVSADGKRIASGGSDRTVRVWDAARNPEALTIKAHTDSIGGVAVSGDGKRIVSGAKDGLVKVWDVGGGQALHSIKAPGGWVASVAASGDGKRIAVGNWDGTIHVWDGASGEFTLTIKGNPRPILSVVFSPDGKRLVSAQGATVQVWDAANGGQLGIMEHGGDLARVAISSDGKRIVCANESGTIKLWDADTGKEILAVKGSQEGIHTVAISRDGARIISGGQDRMVKVWDAFTGQCLLTLIGHTQPIQCVAISGDGRRIFSGSSDRTVKLWDADTGQEALTLKTSASGVNSVALSGDGQTIACGLDTTIKVWHADRSQP
jgi:eukaryotic-like serine/threonine-protein kinase